MTLTEFKAWFDGYTENLEGAPNGKQWKRIKEQVGKIDGAPITYPVYVDRYVRPRYPYWPDTIVSYSTTDAIGTQCYNVSADAKQFDGVQAMYAAGKMEAGNA